MPSIVGPVGVQWHGSSSQHPPAALQCSGGRTKAQQDTRALLKMECNILLVVESVVVPIISSLVAMEKRLEKIESMQLELKKTNDKGQKDIMQRIADVKGDVVQELEEMTP
ncbi:hypothetical protein CJ030_MR0G028256 [Morella rubra]|uniref:Uncharacterized protein n=1 Tax=Morella rubra TaxID=262757 RepID=A0A6A1UFT1_9ROSI|nr:hypothetical protein CJ030_MR0G028256 [Morella rubra]